jgi:hypothetical protein
LELVFEGYRGAVLESVLVPFFEMGTRAACVICGITGVSGTVAHNINIEMLKA